MSSTTRTAPLVVLVVALLAVLLPSSAAATVDTGSESASLAAIDQERASRGLPALRRSSELQRVARRHAVRMADRGTLHHNRDLGSEVSGWRQVGENVGRGPAADAVHRAFMDSPSHRDNILSASFVEVGVGVERRGDTIWVTQVFRLPSDQPAPEATPSGTPTPEVTTSAAPAPARTAPATPASSAPADGPSRPSTRPASAADATEAGIGTASASAIVPAPTPVVDRLVVLLAGIDDRDA